MSIQNFLLSSVAQAAHNSLVSLTRDSLYINGEYIICKSDLSIVQSKISDMNKRIRKLKEKNRIPSEAPEMEVSISLMKENPFKDNIKDVHVKMNGTTLKDDDRKKELLKTTIDKIGDLSNFISIKLNTEKLSQLTEWTILGLVSKMENTEAYTLSTFTDEPLPDKYKDINNTNPCLCEHCETNRARNNTFILKNEKTEEILQVGASCMKSFVDEKTLKYFFSIDTNMLFTNDEERGGTFRYVPVFDKEEYLATVSASIRRTGGYRSARNIDHEGGFNS